MRKNIKAIRHANLLKLRKLYSLEYIAAHAGVSAAYLSQIAAQVVPKGRKTARSMSNDYAIKIEEGLGLPSGWMDVVHADDENPDPPAWLDVRAAEQGAGSPARFVEAIEPDLPPLPAKARASVTRLLAHLCRGKISPERFEAFVDFLLADNLSLKPKSSPRH